jgi:hypothetical protein
MLPTLQKLFNPIKEWGKYGVFGVRVFIMALMMGELKQIKISNLKYFIVASLLLEYK